MEISMPIIKGSINYTTSGRKRKTYAKRKKKFATPTITAKSVPTYAEQRLAESRVYKSAPDTVGVAPRMESPRYTGNLVKGIGTMHKSNAVPIIDQEQMKDLARMRR
jgi:hypothetical protein